MPERWVGCVIVGESVTVVDAELPDDADEPVVIIADDTWRLQKGERSSAYNVLYQRCAGYLRENRIQAAVVKASAISRGAVKLAHLESAEVRGVIMAAAASVCEVKVLSKAVISRTFGDRKVDEYLKDDRFWADQTTGGDLRRMSREAAMLLVAARNA